MGYLYYGSHRHAVEIDDRPLAHVKEALLRMLREGHGVAFSVALPASQGGGRETLWISPTTDIRFLFSGGRAPILNETWVRAIVDAARSHTGMHMVAEPTELSAVAYATG